MLFRVGDFAAMLAVVAYAVVPAIRYTDHGIRQIDPSLIEAATAAGCTRGQILRKVQLPLALPEIMLGVNQTIMMALSMLVITALVGTRDLGQEVYIALTKADVGRGLVAGVCVACLAMTADRLIAPWAAGPQAPPRPRVMSDRRAERKAAALACWRGKVAPQPLGGGISNHNFLVEDGGRSASWSGSATTSRSTTCCAASSSPPRAPRTPPASRPRSSTPSPARWSFATSRAAR